LHRLGLGRGHGRRGRLAELVLIGAMNADAVGEMTVGMGGALAGPA
jgi:hypothetical protein